MTANGDFTVTSVSIYTAAVSEDIDDYQYLVGTLHRDSDDMELCRTVSVVVEEFDEEVGPIIVAYRRHVSETGALLAMTEDDEYPIQIQNIAQDTAEYAIDQPARVSNKAAKKVAHQLLAFGVRVKPTTDTPKPEIDWTRRLPRSYAEVPSMPTSNPDRAGFLEATAAEIKSIRVMGTLDPSEVLSEEQMKISKIGMSRSVFNLT